MKKALKLLKPLKPLKPLSALSALALLAPLAPLAPAHAFGGLLVAGGGGSVERTNAEVLLARRGARTVMSVSLSYRGGQQGAALLLSVPADFELTRAKTLPRRLFDRLDLVSAPVASEYWEQDPCYREPAQGTKSFEFGEAEMELSAAPGSLTSLFEPKEGAAFIAGEYDLTLLSPEESGAPAAWLSARGYALPAGGAEALAALGAGGRRLLVAAVDPQRVKRDAAGGVTLSPLRLELDPSEALALPARLALAGAAAPLDATVYVLSPEGRHEPSAAPSAPLPSNLDVAPMPLDALAGLHARLVEDALGRQGKAAVTERAWAAGACDPCAAPALAAEELRALGGDLLGERGEDLGAWTLTRLRARLAPGAEDLALRPVSPISGGRGEVEDLTPAGATEVSAEDAFQARYVLRHRWEGRVACKAPRFGVWGGAPGEGGAVGAPPPARLLAGVGRARPAGDLAALIRTPLKDYGVPGGGQGAGNGSGKGKGKGKGK